MNLAQYLVPGPLVLSVSDGKQFSTVYKGNLGKARPELALAPGDSVLYAADGCFVQYSMPRHGGPEDEPASTPPVFLYIIPFSAVTRIRKAVELD